MDSIDPPEPPLDDAVDVSDAPPDSLPDVPELDDGPPDLVLPTDVPADVPDSLPDAPEAPELPIEPDDSIHWNPGPEFPEVPEGEPLDEGRNPDRQPFDPERGNPGGPERDW